MTERDWQRLVIDMATHNGWLVAHFRSALTPTGWRTPVAGDGAGFPDLVLVRDRVLFVELKTDRGRVRPEQEWWGDALARAGAEYHVWRPRDEGEVWRCLTTRPPGTTARPVGPKGGSMSKGRAANG